MERELYIELPLEPASTAPALHRAASEQTTFQFQKNLGTDLTTCNMAQDGELTSHREQKQTCRIVLQPDEDGRVVATCPDLPGVVTDGADQAEALENVRYAVSDMLDSLGEPDKEFNLSLTSSF